MQAPHTYGSADMKITVRALYAQHEGSLITVCVVLESGERREERRLPIMTEQYCEIKPKKGEITEEMYDRIEAASALCQAVRHGEYLLSFGANTRQMLVQKLQKKGYTRDVATQAAERLAEMGLIDEKRDLSREIEKCLRKLWGSKRIAAHLWSRGFDSETMAMLPSALEEIDFVSNCAALIRKHYGALPEDTDGQRRMIASLGRYGYSLSEIREALHTLSEE